MDQRLSIDLQKRIAFCNNSKLRSSSKKLLIVPESRTKTYGDRRFSVAAPKHWNLLPNDIRNSPSIEVFKTKLKTYLFREAYGCQSLFSYICCSIINVSLKVTISSINVCHVLTLLILFLFYYKLDKSLCILVLMLYDSL